MNKKKYYIVLLQLILIPGLLAACDIVDDEINQEINNIIEVMVAEIKNVFKSEVDKAKYEAEKVVREQVGEIKEGISDKADELIGKPFKCTKPEITDSAMNCMWTQIDAPVKNSMGDRSSEKYLCVIGQFDVENSYSGRYQIGGCGSSYSRCNIFAGDVMRAMGAPLPTKGELGVGHGNAKNTDPMTANPNHILTWLNAGHGGWSKININNKDDLERLQNNLKDGKPTLAATIDHIAVVRPDHLPAKLTENNILELHVAQSGAVNKNDVALNQGVFGKNIIPEIFIHE
jgi:hypothetical protein